MPRLPSRVPLENGLRLDLNCLVREGRIRPGVSSWTSISWSNHYGEKIASAYRERSDRYGRVFFGANCNRKTQQSISLGSQPRHFGGRQWYFICPFTSRRVSVLWKPSGERHFACRQHWGELYLSQCSNWVQRCHLGKARINKRLCEIGGFDPLEWELAPKPKWMRWRTYERAEKQFDRYQARLNMGPAGASVTFRTRRDR